MLRSVVCMRLRRTRPERPNGVAYLLHRVPFTPANPASQNHPLWLCLERVGQEHCTLKRAITYPTVEAEHAPYRSPIFGHLAGKVHPLAERFCGGLYLLRIR